METGARGESAPEGGARPQPFHVDRFISFEGVDGSGKTTQLIRLGERLRQAGHEVVATHEPGGTPLGEHLRNILLDPAVGEIDAATEAALLAASRSDHIVRKVRPALQVGAVVLTDRYVASTYAYQGYGSGMRLATLKEIMQPFLHGLLPGLTILLDLDPAIGLERKRRQLEAEGGALSRFDLRPLEYHQKVRDGFLDLAAADPERWLVLDAQQEPGRISARIWERVKRQIRPAPGQPAADAPQRIVNNGALLPAVPAAAGYPPAEVGTESAWATVAPGSAPSTHSSPDW